MTLYRKKETQHMQLHCLCLTVFYQPGFHYVHPRIRDIYTWKINFQYKENSPVFLGNSGSRVPWLLQIHRSRRSELHGSSRQKFSSLFNVLLFLLFLHFLVQEFDFHTQLTFPTAWLPTFVEKKILWITWISLGVRSSQFQLERNVNHKIFTVGLEILIQ